MSEDRAAGHYWVKETGRDVPWEVAAFDGEAWWLPGDENAHSGEALTIGQKVEAAGELTLEPVDWRMALQNLVNGLAGEKTTSRAFQAWDEARVLLVRHLPRPVPMPTDSAFKWGAPVQRSALSSGRPPAYRFPGIIVGWYRTPGGSLGFAVSNAHEPACIQIFPQSGLEPREPSVLDRGWNESEAEYLARLLEAARAK